MSEQIEPGDGWRLIDKAKDAPREGDQAYKYYGGWEDRINWSRPFQQTVTYRRRIPAKPDVLKIQSEGGLKGWMRKDNTLVLEQKDDSGGFECVLIWETKSIRQVIAWLQQVADWREAQGEGQ
jgi:hypothetical protein